MLLLWSESELLEASETIIEENFGKRKQPLELWTYPEN
jgi:hypothetical protein